jgi:Rnl2 family RNA ligase
MFIKYPSLVNAYAHGVQDFTQLVTVTEKLDGSNFSVIVYKKTGEYKFASRNQIVVDGTFNGLGSLISDEVIDALRDLAQTLNAEFVTLYGEIFSSKILRRFAYGETKIRFFDLAVEGKLLPASDFLMFMEKEGLSDLTAEVLDILPLEEALKIDVEMLYSDFDNTKVAEGIVLKGFNEVLTDYRGNISSIKVKSSAFLEVSKEKKRTPRVPGELTPDQENVLNYVTESRVKSAESKLGEFTAQRFGEFMKEVFDDVVQDYKKDYPEAAEKLKSKALSAAIKETVSNVYNVSF